MIYCGIDFGTTNTKAVLVDDQTTLLGRVTLEVKGSSNAQVWIDHINKVCEIFASSHLIRGEKVVCSLTSQGGSFVLLDKKYDPISPAFSWMELSAPETARGLEEVWGSERYYRTTGWKADRWLLACKLKERLMGEAAFVASIPEFIHARLCGRFISDITNAQISGLYDFHRCQWDRDLLAWAGVREEQLPEVRTRLEILAEGISIAGLTVDLVTSSHDQYTAMRAGRVDEHTLMLATGSAWVINGKSREPHFDPDEYSVHPGRDLLPGYFGFIRSFGAVGKEFEGVMQSGSVSDFMKRTAANVRKVLAKVGAGKTLTRLLMTGGALRSPEWPQTIADVCGLEVEGVRFDELTAYGAAMFARSAVAGEDSLEEGWPKGVEVCVYEPKSRK